MQQPNNTDPNKSLGRYMGYGSWLLLLVLLTFLFSRWLDYQENPNRNLSVSTEGGGSVELLRNRSGHYVATGLINGIEVTFLLDTGATHVAVSESLAQRAGLRKGLSGSSMTANGMVRTWLTVIDEVRLGPILQRQVRASILPSMHGNEVLLGMSFLKHLELIQRGDRLIIRPPTDL
jgi:aspartyl protease family protein